MCDKPFFVSPCDGGAVTYAEFDSDVRGLSDLPDELQPSDCYEAFRALGAAIVQDSNLTLVAGQLAKWDRLPACRAGVDGLEVLSYPTTHSTHTLAPLAPLRGEGVGVRADEGEADEGEADKVEAGKGEADKVEACRVGFDRLEAYPTSRCRVTISTSGSSGKPKRVEHSIASLTRSVRRGPDHANDIWGFAYHPCHFAGLQVFFQAFCNCNTIVRLFGLEIDEAHRAIDEHQITHLSGTPTYLQLLSAGGWSHPGVRQVTVGGEIAPQSLRRQITKVFPNARVTNIYAMSEAGALLSSPDDVFSIPEKEAGNLKIVDGQLCIHRSLVSDSMGHTFAGDFYATGDAVEVLENDPTKFRFISRCTDVINVGGYKVNPHAVEDRLTEMPEIIQAKVFGQANSVTGNLVCCDVVLSHGHTLDARTIRQRLETSLLPHEIPRIVHFVDSIEMTFSGKVQRRA